MLRSKRSRSSAPLEANFRFPFSPDPDQPSQIDSAHDGGVKGRKGIGKFAGLILASEMELITQAAGKRTRVLISKTLLMEALGGVE